MVVRIPGPHSEGRRAFVRLVRALRLLHSTMGKIGRRSATVWIIIAACAAIVLVLHVHSPLTQYFAIDLAWRALQVFVSSMGSTVLAYAVRFLMVPAGVLLLKLGRALAHRPVSAGFPKMTWQRWKTNLTDAAIVGALIAASFYCYDLFFVVPKAVYKQARTSEPVPILFHASTAPGNGALRRFGSPLGQPGPKTSVFSSIADRAKTLSIKMQAFMAKAKPPYAPQNAAENASLQRNWNKYIADTVAEFNEQFAADLFTLARDLKDLQLVDNQLVRDISYLEQRFPGWLPEDIHIRVGYISEHLEDTDERAILQIPLKRRLTPRQIKTLKAALVTPPHGKLIIEYSKDEPDAKDYAHELFTVLTDAGWEIFKERPMGIPAMYAAPYTNTGGLIYRDTMGITIAEQRQKYVPAVDRRLSDALNRIGIWPDRAITNESESDAVLIVGGVY